MTTAAGGRGLGPEKISLRLTGDKIVILPGVLARLVNTELAEIERMLSAAHCQGVKKMLNR